MKFFPNKGRFIASTAVLTALTLVLALAIPAGASNASSTDKETKRTISVSAQGIIKASPDIAYVTLGAVSEDKNAKIAQQDNAKIMDAVVKAVKGAGISADDIKTVGYNIYPKYSYDKDTGASSISGYSVSNNIQLTIRDLSKTGTIIDLAADNGANSSSSIAFSISDYEKKYNEALKIAVNNAKTKAKTMADALGIKLDVPVTVSENGGYSIPQYSPGLSSGMKSDAAPTPISGGTLEVSASISMTYQY